MLDHSQSAGDSSAHLRHPAVKRFATPMMISSDAERSWMQGTIYAPCALFA